MRITIDIPKNDTKAVLRAIVRTSDRVTVVLPQDNNGIECLSPQQRDIMRLLANDTPVPEIAKIAKVQIGTIRSQITTARAKLGIKGRRGSGQGLNGLIRYAKEHLK